MYRQIYSSILNPDALVDWIRMQDSADGVAVITGDPLQLARLRRWLAYTLIDVFDRLQPGELGSVSSDYGRWPDLLRRLLLAPDLRAIIAGTDDLTGLLIPAHWQTWRLSQGVPYDLT